MKLIRQLIHFAHEIAPPDLYSFNELRALSLNKYKANFTILGDEIAYYINHCLK